VDKEASLIDFLGRNLVLKLFFESIRCLPEQYCQGVYVSFRFHLHRHAYTTPQASQVTCNPRLDAVICITQRITAELFEYVERGAIELEVWARRPQLVSLEASHLVGAARHQFSQVLFAPFCATVLGTCSIAWLIACFVGALSLSLYRSGSSSPSRREEYKMAVVLLPRALRLGRCQHEDLQLLVVRFVVRYLTWWPC
jgi:hypothetical protein